MVEQQESVTGDRNSAREFRDTLIVGGTRVMLEPAFALTGLRIVIPDLIGGPFLLDSHLRGNDSVN